jgi:hypothetical protein
MREQSSAAFGGSAGFARFARMVLRLRGLKTLRSLKEGRAPEGGEGPGVSYAIALLIAACLLAVAAAGPRAYLDRVQIFPDVRSYAEAATVVRHWQLAGVPTRQFWGYAYVGALLSFAMPGVPMLVVVLIVSAIAGCVAVALAHRIWGGSIAVYLTALGFPWIQRVAFGGSEPLFMALLFASLLSARRDKPVRAALFAALATTVRPIGIFALPAVLWGRKPKAVALGLSAAVAVFAMYCLPLAKTGDALGNVHWYIPQMTNGMPIGWPFLALWRGTRTNLVSPLFQIVLAAAISVTLLAGLSAFRPEAGERQAEKIFALSASCFLITLNCPPCAWQFPRLALVCLPFALVVGQRWLPRDDRVIALCATLSALMAAAMQINDRAPGTALLHLFAPQ